MQIFFKPTKYFWEFWKKDRFLVKGEDYEVSHGRLVLMRALKGQMEVTYDIGE